MTTHNKTASKMESCYLGDDNAREYQKLTFLFGDNTDSAQTGRIPSFCMLRVSACWESAVHSADAHILFICYDAAFIYYDEPACFCYRSFAKKWRAKNRFTFITTE